MSEARTPPHSDEAEQSVLGALLLDNAAFDRIGDMLRAEHFYHADHRAMYSTIASLVNARKVADVITVYESGGHPMGDLNALAASVPSARNIRGYAEIVVQRWRRRELMRIGADLADDAMNGTDEKADAETLADRAVTALLGMQQQGKTDEPQDIDQLTVGFADYVTELSEGKHPAISTGLADLDRLTGGGGRPGELWVIGARPSMGKTAITLAISRAVARDMRVLMLTQEDSLNALMSRHVASAGRVNLADLRNPMRAPESMWAGLTDGIEALTPLLLSMDDQAALTMRDVRRKVQQVRRRHGRCDLVIIDYLQLMDAEGEGDNRNQKLGAVANGLKRLAKEAQCWVILLSQLNREADKRTGPPQMGDLRDSGDIEGAADIIALLYREFMRKPTSENKNHAELHIVKHKNGPTDTLQFFFEGAFQTFADWNGPPPSRSAGSSGGYRAGMD